MYPLPDDVFVYDYVTGKLVQQLSTRGFVGCADTGNVYVLHVGSPYKAAELEVYPHGSNKPSSFLSVPISGTPLNCSISPVDGDLAVSYVTSFTGNGDGFLLVYHRAQGKPKVYRDALIGGPFGETAYDAHGDIYLSVAGVGRFAELRRGAPSINQDYSERQHQLWLRGHLGLRNTACSVANPGPQHVATVQHSQE